MITEINVADRVIARHQAIKEFEFMRNMAEAKALSKISLERPLSNKEYKRFIELGKLLKGGEK